LLKASGPSLASSSATSAHQAQLTGTWSLARPRDQGRLFVDEIIAVKAQKVEWVK
jgi:hypothetical protein